MELLDLSIDEVLTTTRNVRKRLDLTRPVDRSVVVECLELALQAPNGSNNRAGSGSRVDDPGVRRSSRSCTAEGLRRMIEFGGHARGSTRITRHRAQRAAAGDRRVGDAPDRSPARGPGVARAMCAYGAAPRAPELVLPGERVGLGDPGRVELHARVTGARARQRVDHAAALAGARDRRAPRYPLRRVHAGGPVPDRLHDRHRLRAAQRLPAEQVLHWNNF